MPNHRLLLVALSIFLYGCPATNNTDNENTADDEQDFADLVVKPGIVLLREDSETLVLEKSFSVPAGTAFGEAISGINIEVSQTPTDECPVGRIAGRTITDCENWALQVTDAIPAGYRIEALVPASFQFGSDGAQSFVQVFPEERGSASVASLTTDGSAMLASDGSVLTRSDEVLARGERFFQRRKGEMTTAIAAQQLPNNIVQISTTRVPSSRLDARSDGDTQSGVAATYGLALTEDNTIYEWGWRQAQRALIGESGRAFPYNLSGYFFGGDFITANETPIRRAALHNNVRLTSRLMTELSDFAVNQNAVWSDVLALNRQLAETWQGGYPSETTLAFRSGIAGAALAADGRVAVWGDPLGTYSLQGSVPLEEIAILRDDRTIAEDIGRQPRWVERVGNVQQISTENGTLVLLDGSGRVWFGNGNSQLDRTRALFVEQLPGLPPGGAVQISGMRALMADGTVWQWRLGPDDLPTSVQQVPGITNAVDLPDADQNYAILADDTVLTWRFSQTDSAPRDVRAFALPGIGPIADIAGDVFLDGECGRVWRRAVDAETGRVDMVPLLGPGGGDTCEAGDRSHLVQIFVIGDRNFSGSIDDVNVSSPNGPVSCIESVPRRCWWLGSAEIDPSFIANVSGNTQVRDWRWDCMSVTNQTLPVTLRPTGSPGNTNVCKLTVTSVGNTTPPAQQPTLRVQVSGPGSVTSNPTGIDCGATCEVSFERDTEVTLIATASVNAGFLGWVDNGCTEDLDNAMVTIALTRNLTCIARFESITAVNQPPIARFTIDPIVMVRVGDTITLDAGASSDSDGVIVDWSWDIDDDGISDITGQRVTTQFTNAGQQNITLTVTDDDGASASLTQGLIVSAGLSAPPIASFTIAPSNTQAPGSTFNFDASASSDDVGIVSYQWDFSADGTFEGTGVTYSLVVNDVGIRQMRLRVTDADGQFSDQTQDVIVQDNTPPALFAVRVVVSGPGQVDVSPIGRTLPDAACDGDECFLFDVPAGTELTLQAAPFTPSVFQGWSVMECDNIPNPDTCEITVSSERSISATFN
ncbi:MAG: PKD domain-containing protein [Pseudomonadota bacterium]